MPYIAACPFWKWELEGTIHCNNASDERLDMLRKGNYESACVRISFPFSPELLRAHRDKYCCSVSGWRECSIAQDLAEEYERREQIEEVGE